MERTNNNYSKRTNNLAKHPIDKEIPKQFDYLKSKKLY